MKKRILLTIFLIIFSAFSLTAHEKLHLKIGTYENSPKIFTKENGEISGFWADITEYIAQKEDWEIEWIHGNWNQCLQRLENNEIDIMIDVGLTPSRQDRFAFSNETVLLSWTRLYTHKGTKLQSMLELEGKKIAGLKGSVNIEGTEGLKDIIERFDLNCDIIEMDNYIEVFEALEKKEIDAGITNKDFGTKHENDYKVERTPIIFQPAHIQFAFSKDSELTPYLIERTDFYIKELKKDNNSIFYSFMDKYLGGLKKTTIFPLWLKITIAIIIFLIVIVFIFDIFLRHQVVKKTAQLRKSEEQFRFFAENVPGCVNIYRWYPDGHREYIYRGPGLQDIIGEELANKIDNDPDEYFKLIPEEDFKALDEASLKALKTNNQLDYEYRIKIDDTNIKWVRSLFNTIPQGNGVILWQGIVYDITQRKQAENAMRESEEKYRVLFDTAKDAIFLTDETGRFVSVNLAACESLGYSKEELLQLSNKEIDSDTTGYEAFTKVRDGLAKKIMFEVKHRRKDGILLPVEIIGSSFSSSGKRFFFAIARDITEQKHAEEELRKRLHELEIFQKATMGRESRIIELKQQVNEMLVRMEKDKKYNV